MRAVGWLLVRFVVPAHPVLLLVAVCGAVGFAIFQMAIPWAVARLIDDVLITRQVDQLAIAALTIPVSAVGSTVSYVIALLAFKRLADRVLTALRLELFRSLEAASAERLSRQHSGQLASVLVEDAAAFVRVLNPLLNDFVVAVCQLALLLALLTHGYGATALVAGLAVPLGLAMPVLLGRRTSAISRQLADARGGLMARIQELVEGLSEIKLLNLRSWGEQRLEAQCRQVERYGLGLAQLSAILSTRDIISWSITGILYWYGGMRVLQGEMTMGQMVLLVWYVGILEHPTTQLVSIYQQVGVLSAIHERLLNVLGRDANARADGQGVAVAASSDLDMRNVCFSYATREGCPALSDVSLTFAFGQCVAIVGPSGSGKSTLAALAARLYEPNAGTVSIGGDDIRGLALPALRRRVGVVRQDAFVFDGTVEENLLLGAGDVSSAAMRAAVEIARAREFIESLPQGYQTRVGERGAALSGGQKQRLVLARMLLRNYDVLVLDEATSALDADLEQRVIQGIRRHRRGRTTIFIAHRFVTLIDADLILVLMHGRVVGRGKHRELLATCERYADLYETQIEGTTSTSRPPDAVMAGVAPVHEEVS